MSKNNNAPPPTPPSGIPGAQGPMRMTILFDASTGKLQVDGPINNQVLAYGMLELAKQSIVAHNARQQQAPEGGNIQIVKGQIPPFPK